MMSPLLVALGVAIPVAVGRLTAGPRPLSVFLAGYPLRIVVTLVYAAVLPLAQGVYSAQQVRSYNVFRWGKLSIWQTQTVVTLFMHF
jgi:hypothetical protein